MLPSGWFRRSCADPDCLSGFDRCKDAFEFVMVVPMDEDSSTSRRLTGGAVRACPSLADFVAGT
jgi:hypothetical protein